ncbi:TIGR00725 family protein [Kallotenue papyrolyticum]|uniref:TIGR00725 family protein n=1 Tax=Kallotenue papyrolyticum TaxID=1325125 RepID=UPI0004AD12F8|nr:TIGR00725 family protein [Kallotenue papyrolyticum]
MSDRYDLPPIRIAVCGTSQPDAGTWALAEEVGRRLAQAGAIVYCGGLGGVMEAVCRGARAAQGLTVGVLPGAEAAMANPYVVVPVPTGCGEARNAMLIRCAEAVIAIGGGWGTLSEIALARRAGLMVIGLRTWEQADSVTLVERAGDAAEAVARALEAARQHRGSHGSAVHQPGISPEPV